MTVPATQPTPSDPPPSPTFDPVAAFPAFYSNPTIQHLGGVYGWTVSDENKRPIDMRRLVNGELYGASSIGPESLMHLEEFTQELPTATNAAYYLQATYDEVLVIDIEPGCPPHTAQALLALPNLYTELSMSGNGYHIIMPLPKNINDFPVARNKKVLREEHGWYEVLITHWVTFTRVPVPPERFATTPPDPNTTWERVYAHLAGKAKEITLADLDISGDKPEIRGSDIIIEHLARRSYYKKPSDFHNDISRWEFGLMSSLCKALDKLLTSPAILKNPLHQDSYDHNDYIWLLYEASVKKLPHRDKHDQYRNGMPILFQTAVTLVSAEFAKKEAKKKTDTPDIKTE